MSTAANAPVTFEQDVSARVNETLRARQRQLQWFDRFNSLWAPLTVFGIVFAVYLVIVELNTCSYMSLQAPLKAFGAAMVLYFVVLCGAHAFVQPFSRLRNLRHHAREVQTDVKDILKRRRAQVDPKAYELLVEGSAALEVAAAERDATVLNEKLDALAKLSDKHLAAFRKHSAAELVGGLLKALLVALAIRAVILEPFKIPSGSMIPTLEIGDQIFVNKFIYGVRIPWTNFVPFVIVRKPERGDVIVFNNPVEPDKDFIKRVVGLPGDHIQIANKNIFINGQQQSATPEVTNYHFSEQATNGAWYPREATLLRESLNGQTYHTLRDPNGSRGSDTFDVYVPAGSVFVMGDNRDNSSDSRYGLGRDELGVQYVPYGNIKGKAMVIWLSLSYGGLGSGLFGGTGLRIDRLFQPVRMCGTEPVRSAAAGVTP